MRETQQSITQWANETFGRPATNLSIALRAKKELDELISALTADDKAQKALDECADIRIVLCRLVEYLGGDYDELVDAKMTINRQRTWRLTGDGHGQHV